MLDPGTRLAGYRIVELLASGGMGQVYVAEDGRLERRIALKVLPSDMARDPERLERFEREARVVASLNHPNIVTIHSVEDADGPDGERLHFITMELVEGDTLDKVIPHGGLAIDRFFAVSVPLADAVGAAHQKGVTHRDLKPGNVMFTADGRLKVLDFGLAKLAEISAPEHVTDDAAATAATMAAAPITEEGKVIGTVAYMSPEQAEGKSVDNRSDIFSLGIMLYEMVAGELPFKGDTKISLMSSIIKDTPVSITEIKREMPNHLGRIIKHCLEKDPDRRFQSAQDVRNELVGLKEEIDSGEIAVSQTTVPPVAHQASQPPTEHPGGASGAGGGDQQTRAAGDPAPPPPTETPTQPPPSSPGGPQPSAPHHTDPSVATPAGAPSTTSGEAYPPAAAAGLLQNKLALAAIAGAVVLGAFGMWMLSGGSGSDASSSDASVTTAETAAFEDNRPSVAVLYFDNLSGDESLDWLRSGLTELLVTDLSQSPEIRVLTTDALFEILDETGNADAPVTSAVLVREVAERGNVEHVVVGSFIRAGDTFRLSARLQKPATGETLAAETVEGVGEDSVFASVDDLTRRIKDRLEIPISASPVVDRDLSDVTTASMDAYRNYTDGVNLISQNRSEEAIPVFERALEIDPEFAMAFAKLSVVYGNLRNSAQERHWAERAIENADRLTQRERYYIEGRYYSQRTETIPQSIEAYENALALYPDDSASGNNIGNQYLRMEMVDEAIAAYEETLRRGTPFLPAYNNTANAYAFDGDCDRAMDLLRDFARNQPDYHFGYQDLGFMGVRCNRLEEAKAALATYRESVGAGATADIFDGIPEAHIAILEDDFDRVAEEAARLRESPSPIARLVAYPNLVALAATYRGRQSEAVATLTAAAEAADDFPGERAGLWQGVARAQIQGGNPEAALESLDRAIESAQLLEDENFIASTAAIAQARAGRAVAARTAAREHGRLAAQLPPPWVERDRLLVEAEIAIMESDLDSARRSLEEALDLRPPGLSPPQFADQVYYTFPLAEVRYRQGDLDAAAELFTAITEMGSQRINQPYEYVRSFWYLGKIAEEDGNATEARRNYQRFLEYWGDGELDRDRVDEARAFVDGF